MPDVYGASKRIIIQDPFQCPAKYFRITNRTTQDNIVSYCGEWYEHESKN
jgi:hypothetical protein